MSKRKKPMAVYLLVDRSGSMASRWTETLSAITDYVQTLAEADDVAAEVTVATFDWTDGLQFDVIRDAVPAESFKRLLNEVSPRGFTPLFDAIGRIVALAETAGPKRTGPKRAVIAVITDGAENASREVSKAQAKAHLDRCRAREWQVLFLGADFDAFDEAASVGLDARFTVNMTASNYGATMRGMAAKSAAYATTGQGMQWDQQDRAVAAGKAKADT